MIHHGDCLEVMATLPAESIDAIVTDPPYGLGFMGKAWDSLSDGPVEASWSARGRNTSVEATDYGISGLGYAAPNPRCGKCGRAINGRDTAKGFKVCHCDEPTYAPTPNRSAQRSQAWHQQWAEAAYRVAKPSAYLLAFGGTRTVHRMTVALEDAGWIIRDMLVWGYACLSDDTEILTEEGWVRYNSPNVGQLAAAFDPDSGELRWEVIEAVHQYDHSGPMVEIGPQLVTLNHRVVIDEATAGIPCLPDMWHDVYSPVGMGKEGERVVLLPTMQRRGPSPRPALSDRDSRGLDGSVATLSLGEDDRAAQSGLERRRYRVQEAWELLGGPLPSSAGVGSADGADRWLRYGTSAPDRGSLRLSPLQGGVREPRGPRPDEQRSREPDALAGQPDAQALRMGQVPGGDGSADEVRRVDGYRGVVWCITVPSGAFLARRNGVVFVTGNSGFPKSKASLKPAWEPIVMARKPGPLRMLAIDDNPVGEDGDRWPANVVTLDGSLGDFARFVFIPKADRSDREPVLGGLPEREGAGPLEGHRGRRMAGDVNVRPDGRISRGRTNLHPTVKPTELMRHLVRLVTPVGGTVLDPFGGSGTTALAAEMEGFDWILIEREAEYVAIAEARLNGTQRGMAL